VVPEKSGIRGSGHYGLGWPFAPSSTSRCNWPPIVHSARVRLLDDSIQVNQAGILNRGYGYDPVGNVERIADSVINETQRFSYDQHDRLTRAWTTAGVSLAFIDTGATIDPHRARDRATLRRP
jgi:YD repeat-containing protein